MDSGGAFSYGGGSLHPEWDLMYRKGLTVKRIAGLCHAVPQTVSRHIRIQRAIFADMETEHLANVRPARPRPPSQNWLATLERVAEFHGKCGRYPTSGDPDPAVRRLARWLSELRRADRAGKVSDDRRALLAVLPAWDRNQRPQLEAERWRVRLGQLSAFRLAEDRWPRFRGARDEAERVLGVWLHAQRQDFGAGGLSGEEVQLLDAAAPGWNAWRMKRLSNTCVPSRVNDASR